MYGSFLKKEAAKTYKQNVKNCTKKQKVQTCNELITLKSELSMAFNAMSDKYSISSPFNHFMLFNLVKILEGLKSEGKDAKREAMVILCGLVLLIVIK